LPISNTRPAETARRAQGSVAGQARIGNLLLTSSNFGECLVPAWLKSIIEPNLREGAQ